MRHTLALTALSLLFVASPAFAQEEEAEPEEAPQAIDVEVIQNRKYELLHEFSLLGGGLPADPYYFGLTATAGYTIHLGRFFAWEIAQFTYSFNFDKRLKEQLFITALRTGEEPPNLPEIDWIVASHAVLKPLYGKEAVFNTEVVHLEAYLQAGPAMLRTTETERQFSFGVDFGAGVRMWLSEGVSMRMDIGELVYFLPQAEGQESDVKQAIHLHLGFGFNLRGED